MSSKNLTKDLTTGSPMKLLLKFATPMILGLFFQQFYNLVDSIIVGRYLGKEAPGRSRMHRFTEFYSAGILYGVSAMDLQLMHHFTSVPEMKKLFVVPSQTVYG